MLLSLILFGSKARGDDRKNSDIDLLGVVDGGAIKLEKSVRGVSQYRYPFGYLKKRSEEGDLFLAHIVHEGRALHDTANAVQQINEAFRFRSSYETEVCTAHGIIEFMGHRERLIRTKQQRSRLIWGIRTLLVARQAEQEKVGFSSRALEEFSGCRDLKRIIDNRYTVDVSEIVKAASFVADMFGSEFVHQNYPYSKDDEIKFLEDLGGFAGDTAHIFLPPQRRRKLKAKFREPLGYLSFSPD